MTKSKIAFVVGHETWGKSKTLKALTSESVRIRRIKISNIQFFIRRMSNDDRAESYVKFMKSQKTKNRPYLIAALCPQFKDKKAKTEEILNDLKLKGYELFFWVIKHQFKTAIEVSYDEIKKLEEFGTVQVYSEKKDAAERAEKFKEFVEKQVLDFNEN